VPPLRAAVVGAGWIANDHVSVLRRLGEAEVVAVCDVDPERAAGLAPPGARTYDDPADLLEREELDAVWVCTPPLHHRAPAVAALERGLHVYLEKPIARNLDDAAAIVDAARRAGAVCAVGYQWHATEALDALHEALEGQEIALLVGRSLGPTNARPWFLDRAQGGGNVLERGSHQIDLLRAVAGDVVSVQAAASHVALAQGEEERGDIEDAASLVLRFAGGALGTILVAWTRAGLPGLYTLDVLASDATLHLTLDPEFTLRGTSDGRPVAAETTQHPFERSIARFLEAVRAGDPGLVFCTPADAAATLAVAQACEQALVSGETVVVQERRW
jgi:predicted dehydrogenase